MPLEPPHAAHPALDMLHKPTKRPKLLATAVDERRTLVYPVRVRGAAEVRVERVEGAVRAVAQHALVRAAVPRRGGRPAVDNRGGGRRGVRAVGPGDEPARVGDHVRGVALHGVAVDVRACDAGRARAALPMEHQVRMRDECAAAVASGARVRAWLVHGGPQVRVELALALEEALARNAIEVLLAAVLVQAQFRVERLRDGLAVSEKCGKLKRAMSEAHLLARTAVEVVVFIMVIEIVEVLEMLVAPLTVRVVGTLDIVLGKPPLGCEVLAAVVAGPVVVGVILVVHHIPYRDPASVAPRHRSSLHSREV